MSFFLFLLVLLLLKYALFCFSTWHCLSCIAGGPGRAEKANPLSKNFAYFSFPSSNLISSETLRRKQQIILRWSRIFAPFLPCPPSRFSRARLTRPLLAALCSQWDHLWPCVQPTRRSQPVACGCSHSRTFQSSLRATRTHASGCALGCGSTFEGWLAVCL